MKDAFADALLDLQDEGFLEFHWNKSAPFFCPLGPFTEAANELLD